MSRLTKIELIILRHLAKMADTHHFSVSFIPSLLSFFFSLYFLPFCFIYFLYFSVSAFSCSYEKIIFNRCFPCLLFMSSVLHLFTPMLSASTQSFHRHFTSIKRKNESSQRRYSEKRDP